MMGAWQHPITFGATHHHEATPVGSGARQNVHQEAAHTPSSLCTRPEEANFPPSSLMYCQPQLPSLVWVVVELLSRLMCQKEP